MMCQLSGPQERALYGENGLDHSLIRNNSEISMSVSNAVQRRCFVKVMIGKETCVFRYQTGILYFEWVSFC